MLFLGDPSIGVNNLDDHGQIILVGRVCGGRVVVADTHLEKLVAVYHLQCFRVVDELAVSRT